MGEPIPKQIWLEFRCNLATHMKFIELHSLLGECEEGSYEYLSTVEDIKSLPGMPEGYTGAWEQTGIMIVRTDITTSGPPTVH